MTLLSLTAYAKTHGVKKQSAAEWKAKGYLAMNGAMVDQEASDAIMRGAGKGRFRIKAHGGRRQAGVRGVPDRPGLRQGGGIEVDTLAEPEPAPWAGWHPDESPHTISGSVRAAIGAEAAADADDELDTVLYSEWDEACQHAGWDRWPAAIAADLAAELGGLDQATVEATLHRYVRARLAALDVTDADLADPRLEPR